MNKKQIMRTTYHCEDLTELIEVLTSFKTKKTNHQVDITTDSQSIRFHTGQQYVRKSYDVLLEEEVYEDDN